MNRGYLDTCCYCRRFDIQTLRVSGESHAIQGIFRYVRDGKLELVWSHALTKECSRIKDLARKEEMFSWSAYAVIDVRESLAIHNRALEIQATGIKELDSLHVACAIQAGCQYFVTTDHRLLKYHSNDIYVCDPIECLEILQQS
jgi:predicted nucleic acid-binding protein